MNYKIAFVLSAFAALVGCQSKDPSAAAKALEKAAVESEQLAQKRTTLDALPSAVLEALQPAAELTPERSLLEQTKYDVKVDNVPAVTFFASLVEDTPYSVAIHPQVSGSISLDLKQVPLSDVFELVSDLYGFDIQRKGNVYRVYPSGMRTETFAVNYLLLQRQGITQTSISIGGVTNSDQGGTSRNSSSSGSNFTGNNNGSGLGGNGTNGGNGSTVNGTNIITTSESDFWANLTETLQAIIGTDAGRTVAVSPQAGLVTIRALPEEIRTVKTYLNATEEHLQRQVILEARIIEVTLTDEYQQGINWNEALLHIGDVDFQFSTSGQPLGNVISGSQGGVSALAFVNQDFSGVINLLSTQGNVQVLSSPRVTATNNQKAVIRVGNDEYFVTDVSTQNTISAATTSTTPNIELTPFFSGIALDVTPQIDQNGSVLLHVHPSVIETTEQEQVITLNEEQFILPLAQSNIRESDTVIRANSGEIVVIGGLMQSIINETHSKTPILGDIPLLGQLFKNRREVEEKRELVILLKPSVIGPNTWSEQIKQSKEYLDDWIYVN